MKRQHLITFLLASFFIGIAFHGGHVFAQTSISGDSVCGKTTECGIADLQKIFRGVFSLIIGLGLPLLIVFIIYRFIVAWYSLQQGNAMAYKDAGKKVTQAIIGFLIIVALAGGIFLTVLRYIGVQETFLNLLKGISEVFIPHVYAQGTQLPNPIPGVNSLYDFILAILSMTMKFFLYPALVGIWVLSGFMYVFAQGAPEKISKAHKLLLWAFISTLVVFTAQGFLNAVRNSVNKIVPVTTTTSTTDTLPNTTASPAGTLDGRVAPQAGQDGSACTMSNGMYGQMAGGVCLAGRGAVAQPTDASYCIGKPDGTACSWMGGVIKPLPGICATTAPTVYVCKEAREGDSCISTSSGRMGTLISKGTLCAAVGDVCTTSGGLSGQFVTSSTGYDCVSGGRR